MDTFCNCVLMPEMFPSLLPALLPTSEDREEVMPLLPMSCDRVDERWLLPTPLGRKAVLASPVMGLRELLATSSDRGASAIKSINSSIECMILVYYLKKFSCFLGIALRLE